MLFRSYGTTQFPIFYEYSGIIKQGRFWHVHFSVGHKLIDSQVGLIDLVKKGPEDSMADVLPRLHPGVRKIADSSAFCLDDFINKPLKYGGFFCWWENYGRNISNHHYWQDSIYLCDDGSIKKSGCSDRPIGNWAKTDKGMIVRNSNLPSMGAEVHFETHSDNQLIGHCLKNGNRNADTSLTVFFERKIS